LLHIKNTLSALGGKLGLQSGVLRLQLLDRFSGL
jgi:hypothetical protein